MSVKFEIR